MTFAERATAHARRAITEPQTFGRLYRQACERFLRDLERDDFRFDADKVQHVCEFAELLPHVEGKWASDTIVLHDIQVFTLANLFGFRDAKTGLRRFTSCLYATARKQGKSTLAAIIMLYCMCYEDEPGALLISAATTGDQARIIWAVAKRMIERCEMLRTALGLSLWRNTIEIKSEHRVFKPINAKASTQDGLNPSHVVCDEVHAHKTGDLINVLQSAAGARPNPLFLFTTTEGYPSPGPWGEMREFVKRVLRGVVVADHFLIIFCAIDEDDDEFDESCWIKASPLLDVLPAMLGVLRREAAEAKQMPGKLAEFRIKRLNRQSSTARGWIDMHRWRKCNQTVPDVELIGRDCAFGIDLGQSRDLSAKCALWALSDGRFHARLRYFIPKDAADRRKNAAAVPMGAWIDGGLVIVAGEHIVHMPTVDAQIIADCHESAPLVVAYDPWNAAQTISNVEAEGFNVMPCAPVPKNFHPAMRQLEDWYVHEQICFGDDPVLNWAAGNITASLDKLGHMSPDRQKSADKIDPIVALLIATWGMLQVMEVNSNFAPVIISL